MSPDFDSYRISINGLEAGGSVPRWTRFFTFATQGGWQECMIRSLGAPVRLLNNVEMLGDISILFRLPLAGGIVAVLGCQMDRKKTSPARWAFGLYLALTQFLVIRVGCNMYYYVEVYCWGDLLATLCVRELVSIGGAVGSPGASGTSAAEGFKARTAHKAIVLALCLLLAPVLIQWKEITHLSQFPSLRP